MRRTYIDDEPEATTPHCPWRLTRKEMAESAGRDGRDGARQEQQEQGRRRGRLASSVYQIARGGYRCFVTLIQASTMYLGCRKRRCCCGMSPDGREFQGYFQGDLETTARRPRDGVYFDDERNITEPAALGLPQVTDACLSLMDPGALVVNLGRPSDMAGCT